MNEDAFEIRIVSDSHCVLRRENEDWKREFASFSEAVDFVEMLPRGKETKLTVLDSKGVRYMQVVL